MFSGLTKMSTAMIYLGTLLLSILSFFTTFYGMSILLSTPLAFIGSLGLQAALLGIAWNLMRIRDKRLNYVVVFLSAAVFSIFFSFANFDSALKSPNRSLDARINYTRAARPVLSEYQSIAKQTAQTAKYQSQRIKKLVEIEQEKGWATAVDEGSQDGLLQSVIDGARRSIQSWEKSHNRKFRQGHGRGPVVNYLESHQTQIQNSLTIIDSYATTLDSLAVGLNSELPVSAQHEIINQAWSTFPIGEVTLITLKKPHLPEPPNLAEFVESPTSRQQAFMLVVNDFFEMDRLALFSLLLAIVIDLIVILMALAGSHLINEEDFLFDRLRRYATLRIKKMKFGSEKEISEAINGNLNRLEKAGKYGIDLIKTVNGYKNEKKKVKIMLKRGEENIANESSIVDNMEKSDLYFRNNHPKSILSNSADLHKDLSKKEDNPTLG